MVFEITSIASLIDVVLFLIGLFILNKFISKEKELGFIIRNSAYILGYSIAISGSFLSNGISFDLDYLLYTLLDIFLVILLLIISIKITNNLILKKLDKDQLIQSGNLSIPIIESGLILATSIILFSSIYGDGKYSDGLIFFVLGQVCLICMILVYKMFTKFDDFKLIENNNISIALVISAMVVGFSLIVASSIFGDSTPEGLKEDIVAFVYLFGFGIVFLIVFLNSFLDKVFFPNYNIEDEIEKDNIPVIVLYSVMKLSLMLIIAMIL